MHDVSANLDPLSIAVLLLTCTLLVVVLILDPHPPRSARGLGRKDKKKEGDQ